MGLWYSLACPQPCESTFFTPQNVRTTIDWLQIVKARDHDGLVGEHIIYAHDTLLLFLAHTFNRTMCEGFPNSGTDYTIMSIFKSIDSMMSSEYRTIVIGLYFPNMAQS